MLPKQTVYLQSIMHSSNNVTRRVVVSELQSQAGLTKLIAGNLVRYMDDVRSDVDYESTAADIDTEQLAFRNHRFSHHSNIQDRLGAIL